MVSTGEVAFAVLIVILGVRRVDPIESVFH